MRFLYLFLSIMCFTHGSVKTGLENLLENPIYSELLKKKRIGLLTHSAALTSKLETSFDRLKNHNLTALFSPEHGLEGSHWAEKHIAHGEKNHLPLYSLHGAHKRPTKEMLDQIDLLVVDLQDIGSRSYTYISTLFYFMEEAAKAHKPVIVCDRPNPMGGEIVDGPLLEEKWRSFVGYINVPYCHGMTIGELALLFNKQRKIRCTLTVVPMTGYRRCMSFDETGLLWIPTSPNIPESDTPLYYPMTGLLGELQIVDIGVGYTTPFKIIGAPWIDGELFCKTLNEQRLPGVIFLPFHYRPFYGSLKGQLCHGARICVTDAAKLKPIKTAYMLLSILKSHAPAKFAQCFEKVRARREMFAKVNGTDQICTLLLTEKHPAWKMIEVYDKECRAFIEERSSYLIYK